MKPAYQARGLNYYMGAIGRFFSWLAQKLTFALLLAVLGVAGLGLWIFLRDQVDFDVRRLEIVRALTGETTRLQGALSDVEARMTATRVEIAAQQDRAAQAAKVAKDIDSLNSGLSRLTADSAQVRADDERIARLKQMETDALKKVNDLELVLKRTQGKGRARNRAGPDAVYVTTAEASKSKILHYAREAWAKYGMHVMFVVGLYFLGPLLAGLAILFLPRWSPGGLPVLLGDPIEALPEITSSRTAVDMSLHPGDTLWVKERFLQASDEGLKKEIR